MESPSRAEGRVARTQALVVLETGLVSCYDGTRGANAIRRVEELFVDESNPWFCINAVMLKVKSIGDISGRGMSPLRYCTTCRMVGLTFDSGCEHKSPNFNTKLASLMLTLPLSLWSITARICSLLQCSNTQSVSKSRWPSMSCSTGLRPLVTSRRNAPKANTSVRGDALPVSANSGAI
uniref:Uncharacterized protein n=1 Tax=Leersia perrieri TaxID=77586 RepID=A0A0D9VF38_9ORYZ